MQPRINEFKKQFSTLLGTAGKIRVSNKQIPRHFRRLDSIARLLEGGSICAAIYFHQPTKTLWIANNKIHATSRDDNNEIKRIREIFDLISQPKANIKKIIDYLTDVTYWHISQEKRYEKAQLDNINIKNKISKWIEEFLLSGEKSNAFKQRMLEELEDESKSVIFTLKKTIRMVRDFIKVRSFLLENKNNNATATGILNAIRNGRIEIVHSEAKNVHAEMRLLSKKIATNAEANKDAYFGISKLCCNHCALAMKHFNVQTRGVHGQGANWVLPAFISTNPQHTQTFFGNATHTVWKSLSKQKKNEAQKYIESKESSPIKGNAKTGRDMYADSSSSDLEFGVQLSTDSQEDEINDFTLQNVWELKEVKQFYKKQYEWLCSIGLTLAEIVKLYADWPKFLALTDKNVRSFINECGEYGFDRPTEKNIFDELSEKYSDDIRLFEKIISTSEHLIRYHGFNELVTRLETHSDKTSTNPFNDADSNDPYSSLEKDYRDDHGCSYEWNSDDSQNCRTHGSDTESEGFDNADSEEEYSEGFLFRW